MKINEEKDVPEDRVGLFAANHHGFVLWHDLSFSLLLRTVLQVCRGCIFAVVSYRAIVSRKTARHVMPCRANIRRTVSINCLAM